MSESSLSHAAVTFAIGGSIALLFTLWGLSFVLLAVAGMLYGRLHSIQEQKIDTAILSRPDPAQTAASLAAPTQTEQLLNDAGLDGELRG